MTQFFVALTALLTTSGVRATLRLAAASSTWGLAPSASRIGPHSPVCVRVANGKPNGSTRLNV